MLLPPHPHERRRAKHHKDHYRWDRATRPPHDEMGRQGEPATTHEGRHDPYDVPAFDDGHHAPYHARPSDGGVVRPRSAKEDGVATSSRGRQRDVDKVRGPAQSHGAQCKEPRRDEAARRDGRCDRTDARGQQAGLARERLGDGKHAHAARRTSDDRAQRARESLPRGQQHQRQGEQQSTSNGKLPIVFRVGDGAHVTQRRVEVGAVHENIYSSQPFSSTGMAFFCSAPETRLFSSRVVSCDRTVCTCGTRLVEKKRSVEWIT